MSDNGLERRYSVKRTDGTDAAGEKHDGCEYFVLDLTHDPKARAAASTYAALVEETNPALYLDLSRRLFVLSGWSSQEEADAWAEARASER